MLPSRYVPLPLIPHDLLRRHHVHERRDPRFRSAARLLQSLWRANQELDVGLHRTRRGGHRRLGSRLSAADATAGRNFLHPAIAGVARHALIYREPGALLSAQRLMENLLSSSGLTFNALGPLALNYDRAAVLLRQLLPNADIAKVERVMFEHSPGRGEPAYTFDRTALDAAVIYRTNTGQTGFIGMEVKFSEGMTDQVHGDIGHLDDLAQSAGLYTGSAADLLQRPGTSQLTREHLLTQATLMHGLYDVAHFVLIGPRQNDHVVRAARLYASQMAAGVEGVAPFAFLTLEQLLEAYRQIDETAYADLLFDRYLDFAKIDQLIGVELSADRPAWQVKLPADAASIALAAAA